MLNEIIKKHPSLLYAQEIADICRPLLKFNINYFAHVKIDNEKNFSGISSHPYFTEFYLKNRYFVSDIHMVDASMLGNYIVWNGVEFGKKSTDMCCVAGEFGIHNPLTVIEKNNHETDYYHFASNSPTIDVNRVYIASLDLLKLFISHFNACVAQSKTLRYAYHLKFNLASADPNEAMHFSHNQIISHRTEFLESLHVNNDVNRLHVGNATLSKRQSEILHYVIRGKTFKEISRMMGLSPRTVGHYFEAIKNKLNVSTRSEVIDKIIGIEAGKN